MEFIAYLLAVGLGFGSAYLYFVKFKGYCPPKPKRKPKPSIDSGQKPTPGEEVN